MVKCIIIHFAHRPWGWRARCFMKDTWILIAFLQDMHGSSSDKDGDTDFLPDSGNTLAFKPWSNRPTAPLVSFWLLLFSTDKWPSHLPWIRAVPAYSSALNSRLYTCSIRRTVSVLEPRLANKEKATTTCTVLPLAGRASEGGVIWLVDQLHAGWTTSASHMLYLLNVWLCKCVQ